MVLREAGIKVHFLKIFPPGLALVRSESHVREL
jgi:hypothetical protein